MKNTEFWRYDAELRNVVDENGSPIATMRSTDASTEAAMLGDAALIVAAPLLAQLVQLLSEQLPIETSKEALLLLQHPTVQIALQCAADPRDNDERTRELAGLFIETQ